MSSFIGENHEILEETMKFTLLKIIKSVLLIVSLLFFFKAGAELSPMSVEEAEKIIANPSPEIAKALASVPNEYSFYLSDSQTRPPLQNTSEGITDELAENALRSSLYSTDEGGGFYLNNKSTVNYAGEVMRQVLINDLKLRFSQYNRGQFKDNYKEAPGSIPGLL